MTDDLARVAQVALDDRLLSVDPETCAATLAHVVTHALVRTLGPDDSESFDTERYLACGVRSETPEQADLDVLLVADYVCNRPQNVTPHQLWNKAAEMGLHDGAPEDFKGGFSDQPAWLQLSYSLFCRTCRLLFIEMGMQIREVEAARRAEAAALEHANRAALPLDGEGELYERMPGLMDRYGDEVTGNGARAGASGNNTANSAEQAVKPAKAISPAPAPAPDPDAVMSIGERPVKHQGKPGRGGARTRRADRT